MTDSEDAYDRGVKTALQQLHTKKNDIELLLIDYRWMTFEQWKAKAEFIGKQRYKEDPK